MNRTDFRFLHRLRVRWAEVDAQGIVFNAHYLTYLDTASTEYWRATALPYPEAFERLAGDIYARKATIEYHRPARTDDDLEIGMRCSRRGTSSMTFDWAIFRQHDALVTGEMVYVFADRSTQRPSAVPLELHDALDAFEAGEPMVSIRTGSWTELGADARNIRTVVFVQEQRIPASVEWDEADARGLHAVAYNRLGMPLATGRLLEQTPRVARLGRLAALHSVRGSGRGRAVLDALLSAARDRGAREALLHAQAYAVPFFRKAGFVARGPEFDEAGIPHIVMYRPL